MLSLTGRSWLASARRHNSADAKCTASIVRELVDKDFYDSFAEGTPGLSHFKGLVHRKPMYREKSVSVE